MRKTIIAFAFIATVSIFAAEETATVDLFNDLWVAKYNYRNYDAVLSAAATMKTLTNKEQLLVAYCKYRLGELSAADAVQALSSHVQSEVIQDSEFAVKYLGVMYSSLPADIKPQVRSIIEAKYQEDTNAPAARAAYFSVLKAEDPANPMLYTYYLDNIGKDYGIYRFKNHIAEYKIAPKIVYNDVFALLLSDNGFAAWLISELIDILIDNGIYIEQDKYLADMRKLNIKYSHKLVSYKDAYEPIITKIRLTISALSL